MEQAVSVPKSVWTNLNLSWVMFFIVMGTANLYVAFNYSSEVWVNFKLFGILGLTLVFAFGQAIYMSRYMEEMNDGKE
jgi:intracellular septation protein